MTDITYQKFVHRWKEVIDVPPQTVGPLTPFYKALTKRLKVMPWPVLVFSSLLTVIAIYIVLGTTITFVVSLLQRGF